MPILIGPLDWTGELPRAAHAVPATNTRQARILDTSFGVIRVGVLSARRPKLSRVGGPREG